MNAQLSSLKMQGREGGIIIADVDLPYSYNKSAGSLRGTKEGDLEQTPPPRMEFPVPSEELSWK